MSNPKVHALSTAEWSSASMGVALFDDGKWHALMGVDSYRLSDYPMGAPTQDGARFACYVGTDIHLSLVKREKMPPFDQIIWMEHPHPEEWVREFYSRSIWDSYHHRAVRI